MKLNVIKHRFITPLPSIIFMVVGFVMLFAVGFNKSIDFDSGLSERIEIATPALTLAYMGEGEASTSVSSDGVTFTFRTPEGVKTERIAFSDSPTVQDLAFSASSIPGVEAVALEGSLPSSGIVTGVNFPSTLSSIPASALVRDDSVKVGIDEVRHALSSCSSLNVQTVGTDGSVFSIRLKPEEGEGQKEVSARVLSLLEDAFGEGSVAILQSDFVGPKFSSSLFTSSILAVVVAVALILVYIAFRFTFSYAVSSIIALVHDVLMMLSFTLVFRLEVSSTTIAVVLTIIGYSLNNTIVIFDRVRENLEATGYGVSVPDIIDRSVSESLTRTVITTLTTLFAVIPLSILSSGQIRLFAIELTWGLVVGAYSSNFIAPSLLYLFHKLFRIDKPKKKKAEDDFIRIGDAYV